MTELTCRRCGAEARLHAETSNLGDALKQCPGWGHLFDVSNGLESAFYCPPLFAEIQDAAATLQKALGPLPLRYAHVGSIKPRLTEEPKL